MSALHIAESVVCVIAAIAAIGRLIFWLGQGQQMQISGHMSPAPSVLAEFTLKLLSVVLLWALSGRITIKGKENLRGVGRLVLLCNHTHALDFPLVAYAVPFSFRYLAAAKTLENRIFGVLGAWTGAIPVKKENSGGGKAACAAGVQALTETHLGRLVIYPQGHLIYDNVLRAEDFQTGSIRIAREAAKDGQPLVIVPAAIDHEREPRKASWLRRRFHPGNLKRVRDFCNYTCYGSTINFGEPIDPSTLPDDPHQATNVIRLKIQELLDQAPNHNTSDLGHSDAVSSKPTDSDGTTVDQHSKGVSQLSQETLTLPIRDMIANDIPTVAANDKIIFATDYFTERQIQRWMRNPKIVSRVGEVAGKLVGNIMYCEEEDALHIMNLAVLPQFHGTGVGRLLFQDMLDAARRLGTKRVYLEVRADNARAIRFYQKYGFQQVDTIPKAYSDGVDAFVMELCLS